MVWQSRGVKSTEIKCWSRAETVIIGARVGASFTLQNVGRVSLENTENFPQNKDKIAQLYLIFIEYMKTRTHYS